MAGSKSDPVVLDPLQTIIEVGWPSPLLAVGLKLTGSVTAVQGEACDGGPSDANIAVGYAYASNLTVVEPTGGILSKAYRYSNGDWTKVAVGDVTLSGVPDLPTVASPDAWVALSSIGETKPPWFRWTETTGTSLDRSAPEGGTFIDSLAPKLEFVGPLYDTGATCWHFSGAPDGIYTMGAKYHFVEQSGGSWLDAQSIVGTETTWSINGLKAAIDGKTYEALGICTHGMDPYGAAVNEPDYDAGILWVLLKKSTV